MIGSQSVYITNNLKIVKFIKGGWTEHIACIEETRTSSTKFEVFILKLLKGGGYQIIRKLLKTEAVCPSEMLASPTRSYGLMMIAIRNAFYMFVE